MACPQQFGFGIQRLIDAQLRWSRSGHPVYLRLKKFTDPQTARWAQLGFTIQPGTVQSGTKDCLIAPPPSVTMISVHNIGQSVGRLRFGARSFTISASFVEAQALVRGLADQNLVWRDSVVGLVTENLLFSIEDIRHKEVAGRTVLWTLLCNANEIR